MAKKMQLSNTRAHLPMLMFASYVFITDLCYVFITVYTDVTLESLAKIWQSRC